MRQNLLPSTVGLLLIAALIAGCGSTAKPAPAPGGAESTGGSLTYGEARVEEIEVLILESFPVQVNVVARGNQLDGCTEIDDILEERNGNAFQVTITTVRRADGICTDAQVPFEAVIDLDVLGLEAGTYTVEVNDMAGSFELALENELQEGYAP